MFGRFQTITNGLKSLGRTLDVGDNNRKILRSLPKSWRPKVTAIQEAKNLNDLRMEELLGSLKVHELELSEDSNKKKSLALKSKVKKGDIRSTKAEAISDEEEDSEASSEDDEDLASLNRKIKRMLQNKGKFRCNYPSSSKSGKPGKDLHSDKIICYECKKPGHLKTECPKLKRKFFKKKKGFMSTWEDLDESTSEEEEEDESEEANLCLMADLTSDSSDESDTEVPSETLQELYDDLVESSKELFREYKFLTKAHKEMSIKYGALEKEHSVLKEKLLETEKLSSTTLSEENMKLQKQVIELTEDLSQFVNGTKNLNMILGNQKNSRDRTGLGFQKQESSEPSTKSKALRKVKKKIICSYCKKGGHNATQCKLRRHSRPKTNNKGPIRRWVPKTLIVPVADVFNRKKETPRLVPGQWVLATYNGRKVFVPKP